MREEVLSSCCQALPFRQLPFPSVQESGVLFPNPLAERRAQGRRGSFCSCGWSHAGGGESTLSVCLQEGPWLQRGRRDSRVYLLCSAGFSDDDRMNDLQAPKEGFIPSCLYTGTDIGDGTRSFLRFHRFFQLRGKWEKPKQAQVGRLFAALCPLPE